MGTMNNSVTLASITITYDIIGLYRLDLNSCIRWRFYFVTLPLIFDTEHRIHILQNSFSTEITNDDHD